MSRAVEEYLKPDVVQQIARLDLRAKFIVKGFLQGLHASPFQGFSVEFSEHRRYAAGDDPKDIDWLVYAKTDKHYIKKYEAETNITGFLVVDTSGSMGYTYRQQFTKLDYSISLASALCWLMVHQQDPCGLVVFGEKITASLPARSRRSQISEVLSLLSKTKAVGASEISASLIQIGAMLRHRSLLMIFSDLLAEPAAIRDAMLRLRHRNHDIILFHVLDEAEVRFPFQGMVELTDPESSQSMVVDADAARRDYVTGVEEFRDHYRQICQQAGIDYVPLDTSMPFDAALMEYLINRQQRA